MAQNVAQLLSVEKIYRKSHAAPPVHALRDINLEIPKGQYLAIMAAPQCQSAGEVGLACGDRRHLEQAIAQGGAQPRQKGSAEAAEEDAGHRRLG